MRAVSPSGGGLLLYKVNVLPSLQLAKANAMSNAGLTAIYLFLSTPSGFVG
jgi:hypothetical protein